MASFPIQAQHYDGATVEATILDMEDELNDEQNLRATLDDTTNDKIISAQSFLSENTGLIEAQLARLTDLNVQIRAAVQENESLESDDAAYQSLILSEPFTQLADKLASLQTLTATLADFLVLKGRRGRPHPN